MDKLVLQALHHRGLTRLHPLQNCATGPSSVTGQPSTRQCGLSSALGSTTELQTEIQSCPCLQSYSIARCHCSADVSNTPSLWVDIGLGVSYPYSNWNTTVGVQDLGARYSTKSAKLTSSPLLLSSTFIPFDSLLLLLIIIIISWGCSC